jgi:hypothetical protein
LLDAAGGATLLEDVACLVGEPKAGKSSEKVFGRIPVTMLLKALALLALYVRSMLGYCSSCCVLLIWSDSRDDDQSSIYSSMKV